MTKGEKEIGEKTANDQVARRRMKPVYNDGDITEWNLCHAEVKKSRLRPKTRT